MKDLVIIGAGGTAQEIAEVVEHINGRQLAWNVRGYLDDDPAKLGAEFAGVRVIGGTKDVGNFPDAQFVIGLANADQPALRRVVFERLGLPRERFATIVHPSAHISRFARLGCGVVVMQEVVISVNAALGDFVIVGQTTSVGHDDMIEDYVTIAPAAVLSGFVRVRRGAFIGTASAILPRATIGEEALVGIGSVVITDVEARASVLGNPARPVPTFR